jgi:hypothetical protein
MLSLLTPKQSEQVGGPIGSLREAKKVESYPNYDAAYLAKRLGARNPTVLERNRYNAPAANFASQTDELVYLQNATKGYEAEAEECLKKEFKDWLAGKHMDNVYPQTYDNTRGGAIRRDMHGQQVDNWKPTWWGPHQLTYLPGVREYLREQAERADKNSLDLNVLAHLGPQNLEEAWAYFKHWVKARPVGPEECLNKSPVLPNNVNLPFRAGPRHMQHDTQYHPDQPYGGGGGGGGWFGGGGGVIAAPAGPAPRGGAPLLLEGPAPSDDRAWRSMATRLSARQASARQASYNPPVYQTTLARVNGPTIPTILSEEEPFWADRDLDFESQALRAPPPTPAAEPIEQVLNRYDDSSTEALTANSEGFELDEEQFERIESGITDRYLDEAQTPSGVLSVPALFDLASPQASGPQVPLEGRDWTAGGTAVGAYSPGPFRDEPAAATPSSSRPVFGRVALRRASGKQPSSGQTVVGETPSTDTTQGSSRRTFYSPMLGRMLSVGRTPGSGS